MSYSGGTYVSGHGWGNLGSFGIEPGIGATSAPVGFGAAAGVSGYVGYNNSDIGSSSLTHGCATGIALPRGSLEVTGSAGVPDGGAIGIGVGPMAGAAAYHERRLNYSINWMQVVVDIFGGIGNGIGEAIDAYNRFSNWLSAEISRAFAGPG